MLRRLSPCAYLLLFLCFTGCVISPRRDPAPVSSGGTAANFSITVSPNSQEVIAGDAVVYTVSVNPANGFTGVVDLTVSNVPSNIQASLNGATIFGGSGSTSLTILTFSSTAPGPYNLTINGVAEGSGESQQTSLIVDVLSTTAANDCMKVTPGEPQSKTLPAAGNGILTINFGVTPSSSQMSAVIGLSAPENHIVNLVSFTEEGMIQAGNGATAMPYSAEEPYHFRIVTDLQRQVYSVFVTRPGGTEALFGSDLPLEPGQQSITNFQILDGHVISPQDGMLMVCNVAIE